MLTHIGWLLTFVALAHVCSAIPLSETARSFVSRAKLAPFTVAPSGPKFVVYQDQHGSVDGPPKPADIKGFNVFTLAFWMISGPSDKLTEWTAMSSDERKSVKDEYKAANIALIVSLFGAEDQPTTKNTDAADIARDAAAFVKKYDLDGVDVDYEDFDAVDAGTAADWLKTLTQTLREELPQNQYILSHAPIAPWFADNGPYLQLHNEVGDLIAYYNVQFYNQGSTEYTDCNGLLNNSGGEYPGSSLFEIAKSVDQDKIVIGKVGKKSDADDGGYMEPSLLAECADQAVKKGWNGGIMVWEYPNGSSDWIRSVRSIAWPL